MPRLLNPAYPSVVVGVASTELAAADADRVTLTIINISDEVVWAAIKGGTPVVGTGIPIMPSCGINITREQFSEGQVNGICASGGKTVLVLTDSPDLELMGSVFTLGAGSATIGAVMIEDADSSTRATVKSAQDAPDAADKALVVQALGASGEVVGSSPQGITLADVVHELQKIYRVLTVIAEDEVDDVEP